MDITITLTPVELDALTLAFPSITLDTALHALLEPLTAKMSEARLQRLATLYRTLSAEDQLEATALLGKWRESKIAPVPAPPDVPVVPATPDVPVLGAPVLDVPVLDVPAPAPPEQGR